MPQPVSMAVRQSIISDYNKGLKVQLLARTYGVSRGTIYGLLKRFKAEGESGLKTNYRNCGKAIPNSNSFIYRAVRCMRQWHPSWGAQKIHAEMLLMRSDLALPHYRTFFRWFHWNGQLQVQPKTTLPKSIYKWAKGIHDIWQVDAKEEMMTLDGVKQCWLNITDEFSGMVIDPPVFPPQEDFRSFVLAYSAMVNLHF